MSYRIEEKDLNELLGMAGDLQIFAAVAWASIANPDLRREDIGGATSRIAERLTNVCIRIEQRDLELHESSATEGGLSNAL